MKGILTTGMLARSREAFDRDLAGLDAAEVIVLIPVDADLTSGGSYAYRRLLLGPRGMIEKLLVAVDGLCSLASPSLTRSRPRARGTGRKSGTGGTAVRSRRGPKARSKQGK